MKKTDYHPRDLNLREVALLLDSVESESDLRERINHISEQFVGKAYFANPLIGGPQEQEQFVCSLDGFDCVTYIETVLALALSKTVEEFILKLRRIRYAKGKVAWPSRNHYMIDWMMNNEASGFVIDVTTGVNVIEKNRTLDIIAGLPAKQVTFRCYPKRRLNAVADKIETGDIALFASVKKRLDVFHTGILIRRDGSVLLRHATRKRGAVVDEKLEEFLAANRMSGLILVRPTRRKTTGGR